MPNLNMVQIRQTWGVMSTSNKQFRRVQKRQDKHLILHKKVHVGQTVKAGLMNWGVSQLLRRKLTELCFKLTHHGIVDPQGHFLDKGGCQVGMKAWQMVGKDSQIHKVATICVALPLPPSD